MNQDNRRIKFKHTLGLRLLLRLNRVGLVRSANNVYITVLTRVDRDDGSSYRFSYTTWGQVYRIAHHAPDGHQLSYTAYNLAMDVNCTLE